MRCYAQVLGERLRVSQAGKRSSPGDILPSSIPHHMPSHACQPTPLRAIRVSYFTKWHYLVVNVLVATILCGYSNQMCKAHLTMEWHQAMTFAKCCAKKCLGTQQEKYLKKPKYKDAPKPQYERERKMKGLYSRSAWLNVGQLFEVCRLEFPLKHTHICTINLLAGCLTNSCHSIL